MAAEKKVTTVTLKDLAASLAETHGVAKSQMNGILAGMVEDLGKHLKKGSRYVLWCSLSDHRAQGMEATLKVGKHQ